MEAHHIIDICPYDFADSWEILSTVDDLVDRHFGNIGFAVTSATLDVLSSRGDVVSYCQLLPQAPRPIESVAA